MLPNGQPRQVFGADEKIVLRAIVQATGQDHKTTLTCKLDKKTYNPVLRQADLPVTEVPWWGGRTLRFDYA